MSSGTQQPTLLSIIQITMAPTITAVDSINIFLVRSSTQTFLPFEGAFANVILGYARQENRNNRLASASSCGLPGRLCGAGEEQTLSEGHTSADYSENQYTASILAGYDHPFGNVTVGPRLGLAFSYEDFGSVKEEGDTGLELR